MRWPLADATSDRQRFERVLASFSTLHQLYIGFWASQMLVVLCFIVVILKRFEFQLHLGAVFATIRNVRSDLVVLLAVYFYIVIVSGILLNVLVVSAPTHLRP
jgi:hypothetical protein